MPGSIRHIVYQLIERPLPIAPLITFRILFGGLMAVGALRFMLTGWIEKLYGEPQLFFKYTGFHWLPVLPPEGMYVVYSLIAVSSLLIMLGWWYRVGTVLFFLTFTYSELVDLTNYLNHYYLVVLLAFWLLFIPANRRFSIDSWVRPGRVRTHVPAWCIHVLLFQLSLVYFFAGVAKLQPDWLLRAMPLAVWLPEHSNMPVLGALFGTPGMPHVFSWFGALYDLTIPFWLLWRPSRPWAYAAVVAFHAMTGLLFNIGLFPLIMISSTLLFFSSDWHERWLQHLGYRVNPAPRSYQFTFKRPGYLALALFIGWQTLMPLRHWLYPGSVLWNEAGYRFSWRVMVVEKNGLATFYVKDSASGRTSEVDNSLYLTPFQEKQLAIQPDFMVQYARFLQAEYQREYGIEDAIVQVDSHVSLNGRPASRFMNPDVDLASATDGRPPLDWISPQRTP